MRYLLKEDELKYNSIIEWVKDNWDKRTPDFTKGTQKFLIQYSMRDLEHDLMVAKLQGRGLTELKLIELKANNKPEFVVPKITISNDLNKGYKTAFGDAYSANKEFLDVWADKLLFDKLKGLASNYLRGLGYSDDRNFYEDNGSVMYGQREINKYDAHLLGDIVSGTFVMSSNDYDSVLINFKNVTVL
jgi:hypothetical protein